jgi:hypothetical protein
VAGEDRVEGRAQADDAPAHVESLDREGQDEVVDAFEGGKRHR